MSTLSVTSIIARNEVGLFCFWFSVESEKGRTGEKKEQTTEKKNENQTSHSDPFGNVDDVLFFFGFRSFQSIKS